MLWSTLLATVVFLASGYPSANAEHFTPDLFHLRSTGQPIWVSAQAAEREGKFRWELFDRYAQERIAEERLEIRRLQKLQRRTKNLPNTSFDTYLPEDLCTLKSLAFSHHDGQRLRDNCTKLKEWSLGIFAGRIISLSQGFLFGDPSSLLTIELESIIQGADGFTPPQYIYASYPYAAFALGSDVFCADDPRFQYRPTVGDRVLMFPDQFPPLDGNGVLMISGPEGMIIESTQGGLFLPPALRTDPILMKAKDFSHIQEIFMEEKLCK